MMLTKEKRRGCRYGVGVEKQVRKRSSGGEEDVGDGVMLMDVEKSRSEGICGRGRIADCGNDAEGEVVADLEMATREEMRPTTRGDGDCGWSARGEKESTVRGEEEGEVVGRRRCQRRDPRSVGSEEEGERRKRKRGSSDRGSDGRRGKGKVGRGDLERQRSRRSRRRWKERSRRW